MTFYFLWLLTNDSSNTKSLVMNSVYLTFTKEKISELSNYCKESIFFNITNITTKLHITDIMVSIKTFITVIFLFPNCIQQKKIGSHLFYVSYDIFFLTLYKNTLNKYMRDPIT